MKPPPLLHNMSVLPTTVLDHKAPPREGRTLCFAIPHNIPRRAAYILAWIDGQEWKGGGRKAEAELRRRLNACAASLPFPPAVLAGKPGAAGPREQNRLAICTVVAKSSDRVYLRDKEPNLELLTPGREVVLYLPLVEES